MPAVMLSLDVRHNEKNQTARVATFRCGSLLMPMFSGLMSRCASAFGFQVIDGFDELFTKALEHVKRQAPLLPDISEGFGKCLVACGFEQQCRTASNAQGPAVGDDVVMVQAAEDFAFGCQAIVVRHIRRHLQDEVFIACIVVDEKRASLDEASPHALEHGEPTFETLAGQRNARVCRSASGSGLVSSSSTLSSWSEKRLDGLVANKHFRAGGILDQVLLVGAAAIQHIRKAHALSDAKLVGKLKYRPGRGCPLNTWYAMLPLEDIQAGAVRRVGMCCFRCEIHQAWILYVVFDVAGAGGAMNHVGRHKSQYSATPFANSSAAASAHRFQRLGPRCFAGPARGGRADLRVRTSAFRQCLGRASGVG